MTEATHTLEDEFRTPDRLRAHVVERILVDGLVRIRKLARDRNVEARSSSSLICSTRAGCWDGFEDDRWW